MKHFFTFLAAVLLTATTVAQVGINIETPDPSAALDITSTTGGLLVPRMTAAQRDAINPAATGLMIYQTDGTAGFYYYNGSSWERKLTGVVGIAAGGTNITTYTQGDILYANSAGVLTKLPKGTAGQVLTMNTGATAPEWAGAATSPSYSIGDFYQGGVIYYLFVDGETGYVAGEIHGLIAAVEDQSDGIRWYNGRNVTTGATGIGIGAGSANTDAIISAQGATETSYAAGLARAYAGGGYTGWFLPSQEELNQMWLNRATINTTAEANGGSAFGINYYWSSTEIDNGGAWGRSFANGGQNGDVKASTGNVRAVRAF